MSNPYISLSSGNILQAAQWAYGPQTQLWPNTSGHAYSWTARKPHDDKKYGIDLHAFSRAKYGDDWRVVQLGFGANDWAWFNPFRQDWVIVPVILVASDKHSIFAGLVCHEKAA